MKAERGKQGEAERTLCCLLRAITSCVSALKDRSHETLVVELLGFKLWSCPSVRVVDNLNTTHTITTIAMLRYSTLTLKF